MAGRTDEQRKALAMQCLQIEKNGGDVLGFLTKNGYPYTPQATWRNMQKDYLKRGLTEITTGKPREKKEETVMPKGQSQIRHPDSSSFAEEVAGAVIYKDADPVEYLRTMGYVRPELKWKQLKAVLAKENPELMNGVNAALEMAKEAQNGPQEPGEDQTEDSSSEAPDAVESKKTAAKKADPDAKKVKKQLVKRLDEFAKKIQESEDRTGKPSHTCCQPAAPSGVSLADMEEPEKGKARLEPLHIAAVRTTVGTDGKFELAAVPGYMHYIWRDPVIGGERYLTLSVRDWEQMKIDIDLALDALELLRKEDP